MIFCQPRAVDPGLSHVILRSGKHMPHQPTCKLAKRRMYSKYPRPLVNGPGRLARKICIQTINRGVPHQFPWWPIRNAG